MLCFAITITIKSYFYLSLYFFMNHKSKYMIKDYLKCFFNLSCVIVNKIIDSAK